MSARETCRLQGLCPERWHAWPHQAEVARRLLGNSMASPALHYVLELLLPYARPDLHHSNPWRTGEAQTALRASARADGCHPEDVRLLQRAMAGHAAEGEAAPWSATPPSRDPRGKDEDDS